MPGCIRTSGIFCFVTQTILSALADPAYAGLSWYEWWYSDQSPLNPHLGAASYVYGEAPLLAGALFGARLGDDRLVRRYARGP